MIAAVDGANVFVGGRQAETYAAFPRQMVSGSTMANTDRETLWIGTIAVRQKGQAGRRAVRMEPDGRTCCGAVLIPNGMAWI